LELIEVVDSYPPVLDNRSGLHDLPREGMKLKLTITLEVFGPSVKQDGSSGAVRLLLSENRCERARWSGWAGRFQVNSHAN